MIHHLKPIAKAYEALFSSEDQQSLDVQKAKSPTYTDLVMHPVKPLPVRTEKLPPLPNQANADLKTIASFSRNSSSLAKSTAKSVILDNKTQSFASSGGALRTESGKKDTMDAKQPLHVQFTLPSALKEEAYVHQRNLLE